MANGTLGSVDRGNFHLAHIDSSSRGRIASFPSFLPGPLVCCKVEGDKQEEVGT